MSTTLYLRFPDRVAFETTLPDGFERQGETGTPLPAGVEAIRIVGLLYEGGTYDGEGNAITPPTLIPGWHINVLGELPPEWTPYQVFPASPQGVFG